MSKPFYYLLLIFLLLSTLPSATQAQDCGCSRTITTSGIYDGRQMKVLPGEVICIKAGTYSRFRFLNLEGTAEKPITIKNCGGVVDIAHTTYYGALDIWGSSHVRVTGTGDSTSDYGIRISSTGSGASGLVVGAKTTSIEIDHVEISGTGFAGMMIKTDPNCDSTTWRENLVMNGVLVHDNFVHHTGGEGLYVGYTNYNGATMTCDGKSRQVLPHLIYGLKIYNNLIQHTKADGIQYACAPDAEVYNNTVENFGADPFGTFQNMGIQIGAGAGGTCFNNKVISGTGNAILAVDYQGGLKIYNNLLVSPEGFGIFSDDRTVPKAGTSLFIVNNTIVTSLRESIRMYGSRTVKLLYNNLLVAPQNGQYLVYGNGATATDLSNLKLPTLSEAGFVNSSGGNYNLLLSSPALNKGMDVAPLGILHDLAGRPRPTGAAFDIGAYESQLSPPVLEKIGDRSVAKNSTLKLLLKAHDADLDSLDFSAQGLPSFVTLTDHRNGTATVVADPRGQTGTYAITFTVSDRTGGVSSETVQLEVRDVMDSPKVLFRVNAGGATLPDPEMAWAIDTQTSPSPYTNVYAAASTTGNMAVNTNATGAPTALFQTMRRDSRGGGNMVWAFPVAAEPLWYRVNFYFVESVSSITRSFNILLENATVASNFEIRAEAGLKKALKKTFEVQVTDGQLTILFERLNEDPLVSAIEISCIGTVPTSETDTGILTTQGSKPGKKGSKNWIIFPNPTADEIFVQYEEIDEEGVARENTDQVKYYLLDNNGQLIRQMAGSESTRRISLNGLPSGTYIIKLVTPEKTYIRKVVKQ
ncbi:malectin domain-containing carbohydrate-binding protein [Telluribacter sp.]|jgi:hypothetical protein|uniref:malectin domain-containing carbohydrate-binding protein n=1 Tax=Telluribacter sp. TaxID=1978767 RepID=UPI002E14D94B|nr:malectin domain-containing carbohydrate-binding protein [Telluribacter sp.]